MLLSMMRRHNLVLNSACKFITVWIFLKNAFNCEHRKSGVSYLFTVPGRTSQGNN